MGLKAEVLQSFTPLGDAIVVKRAPPLELSRGGIVIPDRAQKRKRNATVIAIGPGAYAEDGSLLPSELKINDEVVTANYKDIDIEQGEDKIACMVPEDILAVVERADYAQADAYRALGSRVIIRRLDLEEQAKAGSIIIAPDVARENRRIALILSAGPGRRSILNGSLIPSRVFGKENQFVLTAKFVGSPLDYNEGEAPIQVIDETQCMCLVTPTKDELAQIRKTWPKMHLPKG